MSKVSKNKQTKSEPKKTGFNNMSSRWDNKFDLDHMYDINPDEIKQQQKQEALNKQEQLKQQQKEIAPEIVQEIDEIKKGFKTPAKIGYHLGQGAILGASIVLPTFGYGSVLACSKRNQETLGLIKKGFYDRPFKKWGWSFLAFLPLILMWILTFVASYAVYSAIGNLNYGPILYFLGIGISLACIPLILLLRPNSVPFSSKAVHEMKTKDPKWKWSVGIGVSCFVLVIVFGVIVRFAWTNNENQNYLFIGGLSTLTNNQLGILATTNLAISNEIVNSLATTERIIILLVGAIFAGFFTLIPGLSAGFGFGLMGSYRLVNEAMYVSFTGKAIGNFTSNEAWPIIIVAVIGYVVGFIASIYLMSFVLNKNARLFNSIAVWTLLGSIIASFIALSSFDYQYLGTNTTVLGIAILCLILGACVTIPQISIHLVKTRRNQVQNA